MHGVGGQAKGEEAPKQNLNEYHGFADPPRKVYGDVSVKKKIISFLHVLSSASFALCRPRICKIRHR